MTTTKDFIKELFTLGLPIASQLLLSNLVSLVSNIIVGSLGEANISATSIASTYSWLVSVFVYGCVKGASIIGAQEYGRGETSSIKKLLSFVVMVGVVSSTFFFLLTSFFAPQIMRIYTDYEEFVGPGVTYLQIVKYSFLFYGITDAVVTMLQTVRSVNVTLISSLVSCVTSTVVGYALVYGKFGLPAMGIKGTAIATLLARIFECMTVTIYLLFFDKKLNFKLKEFDPRIDKETFTQLVAISMPILLTDVLDNFTSSAQAMITGRMSEYYLSANSIVHTSWALPSVFCWGGATAAAIMIGNSLGKHDYEQARLDAKRLVITSLIIGVFCSGVVKILVPWIASLYDVSENTVDLAYKMGKMACINVLFISFECIVPNGIIKATGDTKKILYINLLGKWIIALPLGYIGAFYLKLAPEYIYFLLRSGNIVMCIWGAMVLIKDDWMRTI